MDESARGGGPGRFAMKTVSPVEAAGTGSAAASGPAPVGNLRGRVAGGVRWKLVGQFTAQGSAVVAGVFLAHLLTPTEFGLAGMALVFTGLGTVFGDLALSAALVQRPTIDEADRSTAFWTNVGSGVLLTLIGIGVSPLVADFFSRPAVGALFAATSTLFLIRALAATQRALLTREMRFRAIEIRTICSNVGGAVAAVALAFAGAGAWAIIGETLLTAVISLVMLWGASSWRPRLVFSPQSLRTLGSYSGKTLGSQFLAYMGQNMDNLLVGRFLGSRALGLYTVAFSTMFLPIGRISMPIQQVVFAALSRIQDDPRRLREAWLRGNLLITAVNVPAFLGMAAIAPDFVPVVLGHRWNPAIPVLQLLSLAGAAQTVQSLNYSAVQAVGKPGVMFRLRLFTIPLTVACFAVGLRYGIVGVAGFFAVSRVIATGVGCVVAGRVLGCPAFGSVRAELAVTALSAVMGAAVYLARSGMVSGGVPAAARLAVLVVVGIGVYGALIAWRFPDLLKDLRSILRR